MDQDRTHLHEAARLRDDEVVDPDAVVPDDPRARLHEAARLVAHLVTTSAMDDHDVRSCPKRAHDPDDPCHVTVAAYDRLLAVLGVDRDEPD